MGFPSLGHMPFFTEKGKPASLPRSGSHATCFCRLACLKSGSVSIKLSCNTSMKKRMVFCPYHKDTNQPESDRHNHSGRLRPDSFKFQSAPAGGLRLGRSARWHPPHPRALRGQARELAAPLRTQQGVSNPSWGTGLTRPRRQLAPADARSAPWLPRHPAARTSPSGKGR